MKLDKKIVTLYIVMMVAGSAFALMPYLASMESKMLAFIIVFMGLGIFNVSLVLLERYISKRKRPELLHKQQVEARDERNIVIRDKAGAKTLAYLLWVMMASALVVQWFNVEVDYGQWILSILWIGGVVYFSHYYYYNRRL